MEAIETQADLSIADLRGMMSGAAPETAPQPETSETKPEGEDNTQQAESEPAEKEPEPKEIEQDEPLPPGVQKRIAKEAEKQARIQAEIDRAVSATKAKESELAKLQSDHRGSDPVTKPETSERPKSPKFGETGHESETWDEFELRRDQYLDARDAWVKAEALREFEQRQQVSEATRKANEAFAAAVDRQGKDFTAHANAVTETCPHQMVVAIENMQGWDSLVTHLGKNPGQLKELADEWGKNPYEVAAKLGRIRDAVISKPEPKTTATKLPPPPERVGGNASASGMDLQTALETGSMSQFKAAALKAGVRAR